MGLDYYPSDTLFPIAFFHSSYFAFYLESNTNLPSESVSGAKSVIKVALLLETLREFTQAK